MSASVYLIISRTVNPDGPVTDMENSLEDCLVRMHITGSVNASQCQSAGPSLLRAGATFSWLTYHKSRSQKSDSHQNAPVQQKIFKQLAVPHHG